MAEAENELIISEKSESEPVSKLLSRENLMNVFKSMFTNATVMSTDVKKGAKSSANIYVNKKYEGKKATIIIWD